MALEGAVDVAEGPEELFQEVAAGSQGGVVGGAAVAFGEDETVAIGTVGAGRVDVQAVEVEVGEYVDGGKGTTGMA